MLCTITDNEEKSEKLRNRKAKNPNDGYHVNLELVPSPLNGNRRQITPNSPARVIATSHVSHHQIIFYFHTAVSAADIDTDENRSACSADSLRYTACLCFNFGFALLRVDDLISSSVKFCWSGIDCSLNAVVTRFQWL
ncbi:hypothetical protein AKJ16_DCAP02639 [Drosera capensis]